MFKTLYPMLTAAMLSVCQISFAQSNSDYATLPDTQEVVNGAYYRLVTFAEMPGIRQLEMLKTHQVKLLDFLGNGQYVASLPIDFVEKDFIEISIIKTEKLAIAHKLSKDLLGQTYPAYALSKGQLKVAIKYFKDIPYTEIERLCELNNIPLLESNGVNNVIISVIPEDSLIKLAELPFIAFMDVAPPPAQPDDEHGRAMHRSNVLNTTLAGGRKYDGTGVNILCRDDGPIGPHIDFKGRLINDFVDNTTGFEGTHGDGVSGIMAGAGNLNVEHRGMAPGAKVFAVDYTSTFLDETMQLHLEEDVLVTNTSYSNGCNAGYTLTTQTVDQQLYDHPTLMHVFSAGNSNSLACGYGAGDQWGNITGGHKQAKNCLTIGNLNPDGSIAEKSSRGPAYDGRIKPDLVAFGEGHVSASPFNNYQNFSGTSAAAPVVAGIFAQMQHAYQSIFNGQKADAALLKACLLNTADDLGNRGPDFIYGWGQVNALRAVETLEKNRFFKKKINVGQNHLFTLSIPAGVVEGNFMVYWTDHEATPFVEKALVNDLDFKIIGPNFQEHLPWSLDSSPTAVMDNSATSKGMDNLNNMEQITLDNPPAGNYTLQVSSKQIPFGMVEYYLVWEFRKNEITVTYPMGGEAFELGDTIDIQWVGAYRHGQYEVSYSRNGGSSFEQIGMVTAPQNRFTWVLPNEVTASGLIQVRHLGSGTTGVSESRFSIAPVVKNISIVEACPDFIKVAWEAVDMGSVPLEYEVFLLGERYMEKIGKTGGLEFQVPTIQNDPTSDHWIAVRAIGPNGFASKRSSAVLFNHSLLNCNLLHDAALVEIISPQIGNVYGCGEKVLPVKVKVKNSGQSVENDVHVGYRINGGNVILEKINQTLQPNNTIIYQFMDSIVVSGVSELKLEVFTIMANDQATFNDGLSVNFNVSLFAGDGIGLDYLEDFEGATTLPPYFTIENGDGGISWQSRQVIGSDGQMTNCMSVNNYNYTNVGQEDALITPLIDLSGTGSPMLYFDLAYAPYSQVYADGLRVEISTDCGSSFSSIIFEKMGSELATTSNHTQLFLPASAEEWKRIAIGLQSFEGQMVIIKFVNVNGYGNALYIDNIELVKSNLPIASFESSANKVCKGEALSFYNLSEGEDLSYHWDFGGAAIPQTSNSEHPEEVVFLGDGFQTISLTVSNGIESSTYARSIEVQSPPIPGFDYYVNDHVVEFQNNSKYTDNSKWDFGDGHFSNENSPTHAYQGTGVFDVFLSVYNSCGTIEMEAVPVSIMTSNAVEEGLLKNFRLFPNPATKAVQVQLSTDKNLIFEMNLFNLVGQKLFSKVKNAAVGENIYPLDLRGLSKGAYFVQIKNGGFSRTEKLLIIN